MVSVTGNSNIFFDNIRANAEVSDQPQFLAIPTLFKNPMVLKSTLHRIIPAAEANNYLFESFFHWLSFFAQEHSEQIDNYFCQSSTLNQVCASFIQFCFSQNIF